MKEKVSKFIVDNVFKLRVWMLIGGFIAIYFIGRYVSQDEKATPTDIVQVVTGSTIIIMLFYTIISYEYNQTKFRYQVQNSRDTLTFRIATEWYHPNRVKSIRVATKFLIKQKAIIEKLDAKAFHDILESEENIKPKAALISTLNYFESISLGIKQGIIDEEFMKGFFMYTFEHYYHEYLFYIEFRRRLKKNNRMWANFTKLAQKWCDNR